MENKQENLDARIAEDAIKIIDIMTKEIVLKRNESLILTEALTTIYNFIQENGITSKE